MHSTYRQSIGTEIIEEQHHELVGIITDLLIEPDRGTIEGIIAKSLLESGPVILLGSDVITWGKRLHIRSADALGLLSENIRLQQLLDDPRPVIGQRIVTKSGTVIGSCYDVQFDAKSLTIEWLFPRRFYFFLKVALPASDILEITKNAIVVRDQMPREEQIVEGKKEEAPTVIDPLPTPAPGMSARTKRKDECRTKGNPVRWRT